ncbi:MBL fold metallo-hydrolase RNA specificity domain-containing protein [Flectobacillus major]|uniref:MBL fold metallo-hydrolase RNA specificity domain-containing protein n=1 Tax=Flectobacillus major TaxID=103 RepID=UPI000402F179|nr:MBL fold metallo-hydrolase [Flectobacillus major]
MKISFHGAAQTVTGSKHLITLKNGKKLLLDCGMFQGRGVETESLNKEWGFVPAEIDYMVLSHAHIDHSGLIPKLVKEGYKGKIYCTNPTKDLAQILLLDSAHIQESDAKFLNKKRRDQNKSAISPLYDTHDVMCCLMRFTTVDLDEWIQITDDIQLKFTEAGHILGAAVVNLRIKEDDEIKRITFSGDIGRYNDAILKSPAEFPQADVIICESTYGDSLHDEVQISETEVIKLIYKTCVEQDGKLIIPAFSVGRTQELVYMLNRLIESATIPALNVYVDSPLSTEATRITYNHPECFNKKLLRYMERDENPFDFPTLRYITEKEVSQELNQKKESCIIISASGMAEAGRVKHHIANNIQNPKNTILLAGYCEPNSLGGRLKLRPDVVKIFGEEYRVNATIAEIKSLSAHADYEDISQFLACQDPKQVQQFFVVHGEPQVQEHFKRKLIKKGFNEVYIPAQHQVFNI